MATPLLGVDVSGYQGSVDWPTVSAAGITFAVAKITEGTAYVDGAWAANRTGIRAAGIIPGGYHFLRSTSDPAAQARAFLNALGDPTGYLAALDVEEAGLGPQHVTGFVAEWRRLTPHPLGIYTGATFWRSLARNLRLTGCWLWDCGTGSQPDTYVPGAGSPAALWQQVRTSGWKPYGAWSVADRKCLQFSDKGRVPGITGPVDVDAWLGTAAELRQFAGGVVDAVSSSPGGTTAMPLTQDDLNQIASTVWGATFGNSPTAGVMLQHATALDVSGLAQILSAAVLSALPSSSAGAGAVTLTTAEIEKACETATRNVLASIHITTPTATPGTVAP
jgi:GH25 family lysozyme M1 (1,4-beta-N-acetylmuramidase)